MRDLRPVVLVLPRAVWDRRHHGAVRRRVAPQLVRDQPARQPALSLQHLAEESYGRSAIASRLDEDVEEVAVLVDGPPEISALPLNRCEESSGPGGLHPQALTDPDVSVSTHPAPTVRPVNGFALAKGSSRTAVDLSITLHSVAPSLQRHYSAFITTTRNSVPVPRVGTLVSWGFHLNFSLGIGATGSHVPHTSLDQGHAAFMPDAIWAVSRSSPRLIPG